MKNKKLKTFNIFNEFEMIKTKNYTLIFSPINTLYRLYENKDLKNPIGFISLCQGTSYIHPTGLFSLGEIPLVSCTFDLISSKNLEKQLNWLKKITSLWPKSSKNAYLEQRKVVLKKSKEYKNIKFSILSDKILIDTKVTP